VYDKPLIYYPISTLLLMGIEDILIITRPEEQPLFQCLLGDGSQWGIRICYENQADPNGIVEALIIGENFIGDDQVALVLGDNIFYGNGLGRILSAQLDNLQQGAMIFAYYVSDPKRYGVVELDAEGQPLAIEEKPATPKSPYAVTGLYLYDMHAVKLAKEITPSARGELEITDLNRRYLEAGQLQVHLLGRGTAWLDTGTHDSLLAASNFVETIEKRQGLKISSPDEIAYRRGLISQEQLYELAKAMGNSGYGSYLLRLSEGGREYISQ
jgi:glucose-1-phosphate thymidylyltransferase